MKMRLSNFRNVSDTTTDVSKLFSFSKLLPILILAIFVSPQVKSQIIFQEHFNNLTTVNYGTSIQPSTFDAVFDNTGWTSSSSSGQSIAEAGSLCIGKSGSSGGTLSTKAMDLSGSDPITLTFKLKYYGTNSITGSTSSKVSVLLNSTTIFSGVKGVISVPTGSPNYTNADWTTYTITLTGGTAASNIKFVGTSSNYAFMIDDIVVEKVVLTPPALTTSAVSNLLYTTATVGGSITSDNISSITERGVVYSTSPNPQIGDAGVTKVAESPLTTTADFSVNLTGLSPNQTYYVKAYAINTYNTSTTAYGSDVSFTTKSLTTPTVTTTSFSNITSFGSLTGGNVTDDGGTAITQRGVVWSTSANPTVPSASSTSDGTGTGIFTSQITGLNAATLYHVRAYAINSNGPAYGDDITFTTSDPQPALFASLSSLNFPSIAIGTTYTLTYTLTGSTLDGTPVTITAPDGFTVTPATINYTGNSFSQLITVKFSPITVGSNSGTILQTGGGATALYTVNPAVAGNGKLPTPVVTSNVGNDFWLGFGYHTAMSSKSGSQADISIYVSSADKDATVVVEMPGLGGGFTTQEVFIPKGTVQEVSGFPRGDNDKFNPTHQPDSRLYFTGVTNRAIHVYSKDGTPVSVWMYTYSTDNSAAGSMIFPTNTWNTSYAVQAYGNSTNSGIPNSFFFVIGEEDGTEFDFVPSVDILDSAAGNLFTTSPSGGVKYFAGQTYHITLNRGQVFNAMGSYSGSTGLDLTGTTVKSTNCKKIAVFGGNGRCLVDVGDGIVPPKNGSTGSDNLVQQMFPKVAWGTKYYTTPTKHMEFNAFRISVDDPATQVWVNDTLHTTPLTGLSNGFYKYDSNVPLLIESDKPVSVTQFIASQCYATGKSGIGTPSDYGMNGIGDPEMIILSPAQQAINKVTVYSPYFKNGKSPAGGYINVVIPKAGISSFKLDPETNIDQMADTGSSSYTGIPLDPASALIPVKDAFMPYTFDSSYYYAKFKVEFPAAHTLVSDIPFNAIAYGTNDGESYGFNAGTAVKDLTIPIIIQNPYGDPVNSANAELKTCRGTEFKISATLPFRTNRLTFGFGNNAHISPNADTTIQNNGADIPYDSTFVLKGETFYVYKLSTPYVFDALNDYSVTITAYDPRVTDICSSGSDKSISYSIKVVDGIQPGFDYTYNTCINNTVTVTDKTKDLGGYNIASWIWKTNNNTVLLPDNQSAVQNPVFTNPAGNSDLTLRAVNSIGCYSELKRAIVDVEKPVLTFNALPQDKCDVATAKFALTSYASSSMSGGTFVFSGTGVELTGGVYYFNPGATGVSTSSPNVITCKYTATNTCTTEKTQSISVSKSAIPVITAAGPLCIDAQSITLAATPTGGTWSGTGVSGSSFNPATVGAGSHLITYSLNSACSTPSTTTVVVNPLPDVNAGDDVQVTQNGLVSLNASATQGSTYLWSPATYLSSTTVEDPQVRPTDIGTVVYTLTATLNGCTKSDDVTLTVKGKCLDPMKGFTPNNDGYNDKWKVFASEGCFVKVSVSVYNRWGGLVYSADKYDNSWQGTYKGKTLPDGTYYYVIKPTDASGHTNVLTGNVTIVR